jgi:hypothetical protein
MRQFGNAAMRQDLEQFKYHLITTRYFYNPRTRLKRALLAARLVAGF